MEDRFEQYLPSPSESIVSRNKLIQIDALIYANRSIGGIKWPRKRLETSL